MRGERIYKKLIDNPELDEMKSRRKGRNATLILSRNTSLIYRYYYYAKICKLRYDILLEVLEDEYFISQSTIMEMFKNNHIMINKIVKEQPDISYLKSKYTHLSWNLISLTNKKNS